MNKKSEPKPRPGWHSDAKWVVGILAALLIAVTALVVSAARLTERETALTFMSTVSAAMLSPQGLDDPGDIEKVRAQLRAAPGKSLEVLPGVSVTAADVDGKTPRELRLMIFRRLAEPIYDQGTISKTDTPGVSADQVGLLVLLSNQSHQKLLGFQTILIALSIVLLLLLIYFSTGFGRLASPGWVLVLVSLLPTTAIFLIAIALEQHPPEVPNGEPSLGSQAALISASIAPAALGTLKGVYQPLLLTGLGLIIIATIGGTATHLWRHRKEAA